MLVLTGLGNYKLTSKFHSAARSLDELLLIPCYSPQELVEKLHTAKHTSGQATTKTDGKCPNFFNSYFFHYTCMLYRKA